MNNYKYQIIVLVVLLVTSFAIGRYTAPKPSVKIVEKTTEEVKKDEQKDVVKTTTIVKEKDKETTTITEETKDHVQTKKDETLDSMTQIVQPKVNTLNVSALVGAELFPLKPVYGLSVNKQLIGPVSIGVFGLTNQTIGFSIGLNF